MEKDNFKWKTEHGNLLVMHYENGLAKKTHGRTYTYLKVERVMGEGIRETACVV
jgi:hypothetical protein